jgi:hypothetical protein
MEAVLVMQELLVILGLMELVLPQEIQDQRETMEQEQLPETQELMETMEQEQLPEIQAQ